MRIDSDTLNALNTAAQILTLLATVTVAVIGYRFTKRATTLEVLADVRSQVAAADLEITLRLGIPFKIGEAELVKISKDFELRAAVVSLLNAYDELAMAIQDTLIEERLAERARGAMLVATYQRFWPFIERWRKLHPAGETAWKDLVELAEWWGKHMPSARLPAGAGPNPPSSSAGSTDDTFTQEGEHK